MLAALAVGCLAFAALVGCTPQPEGPPLAVLFPGSADDDWGASAEVLRQELASDGYAVEVRFAGDDIPAQLEQLRTVLAARPAAVVIAAVDTTSIAAVLGEADADAVSVIAYDDLVLDSDRVDYFATFDHRAAGRAQGRALVDGLGLDADPTAGPFAVELLAGSADDRGAQDAFAGALEVLRPYFDAGRLTAPSGRTDFEQAAILRGSPTTAAARVAELLDDGVPLAGVLSPSDAMSDAIRTEFDERGEAVPALVLTGGGSTLDGVRGVRDGTQTATVYEDPRALARAVASMVREVVRGAAPTVTCGATTDNGIRDVPTLLLEPQLVTTPEEAERLLG